MLSATAHTHVGDSANLPADRQQLQTDIQQYVNDSKAMQSALNADRLTIATDQKACSDAARAAKTQFANDTKSMIAALKADSLASKPVHDQYAPILSADLAAIKADHEHPDQLATDQAKLETDTAAFRAANAPFEVQTKSDISHWNDVLTADKTAIQAACNSTLLTADKAKLKADQEHFQQLLKADQAKITADNAQIRKDRGSDEPDHSDKTTTHK
ncbi:MAG TPA: hypothetical protein VKK61_05385 [Tepidisphaeraceae bacterium]|nr:hypothetical protein [Tepidisphaeraceae bacterium]